MYLGIEDDHVLLPEDHIPVGDQGAAFSLYKDDDGFSGDVQLLDALADPGMVLLEHHLLELDALTLVVVERLGAQHHVVSGLQHHAPSGDDDLVLSLYGSHDDAGWQMELGDGLSGPLVLLCQMDLDKMDGSLLPVLAHPLDAGILVYEPGGDDTRGDGHNAHTQEGDEDAEHFSQYRDGINVAVAHGEKGGRSPPDPGEGVGEDLWLGFMLQTVHAQAGGEHQHEDDEDRGKKLLFFAHNDFCDHIQGVIVGVDAEQPEDPDDTEHTEGNGPCREKEGEILGKEGQKVYDAGKGGRIFQDSPGLAVSRIQVFCRPDPQDVVQQEHGYSGLLYEHQDAAEDCPVLVEGVDHAGCQIEDDAEGIEEIIGAADIVVLCPHLYDLKNPFSPLLPCILHTEGPPRIKLSQILYNRFPILQIKKFRAEGAFSCPLGWRKYNGDVGAVKPAAGS